MKGLAGITLLAAIGIVAIGCGSSDNFSPNYSRAVNLTPEQKQKEQELMAGQTAPGMAQPAPTPASNPSLKLPPGKGR